MSDHVSVTGAAQELRVGLGQVYSLLWSGKLPGRKVDGEWRISREDIARRLARTEMRHGVRRMVSHAAVAVMEEEPPPVTRAELVPEICGFEKWEDGQQYLCGLTPRHPRAIKHGKWIKA